MVKSGVRLTLAAAAICAGAATAFAGDVTVQLIGEKGTADPHFRLLLGTTLIGEADVTPALDTAKGAWLSRTANPAPFVHRYDFAIPAGAIGPDTPVALQFTNDSFDKATGADANLYVVSIDVDGHQVDLRSAKIVNLADEKKPANLVKGDLAMPWTATATFAAPSGGWVATLAPGAGVKAKPAPAVVHVALASAVAASPPAAVAACAGKTLGIVDFGNGDEVLSRAARARIDAFAKTVDAGSCKLAVVGYASPGGPAAVNRAVSAARAAAVLAYLKLKSPAFGAGTASGAGETSRFGSGAANRRVVVTVGP